MANTIHGGSVLYDVGFNIDKTSLSGIYNTLNEIKSMSLSEFQDIHIGMNTAEAQQKLTEIKVNAEQLEVALVEAFNPKLNTVNLDVFKQKMSGVNLTTETCVKGFSELGSIGDKAIVQLAGQVSTFNTQIKSTETILDKMAASLGNTVRWAISTAAVRTFSSSISQAYGYVKDLDESLNSIQIVTNKTADEMDRFAENANKAAKSLATTTTNYTDAALTFYQQGLSDEEVTARTDLTTKVSNVTGLSGDDAAEYVTAVLNGYKVGSEEAEAAMDKLANVGAHTASSLKELSEGMSKVASSANAMGVSEDQLAASLATVISVTRQDASQVGTAFKTIYARISDIEAGTEDAETTLGNYTGEMAALGYNVLDSTGNLRDLGEVMEEIGGNWENMSREQQIALARTMAGTRQYNNLIALFDNWSEYQDALNYSLNSTGTLQQQQNTYMESTQAHLDKMKASAQDLYDSLLDADSIDTVADAVSKLLDFTSNWVDALGGGLNTLTAIAAILAKVNSAKLSNFFATSINNANLNSARYNNQKQAELKNARDSFVSVTSNSNSQAVTQAVSNVVDVQNKFENVRQSNLLTEKDEQEIAQIIQERVEVETTLLKLSEQEADIKKNQAEVERAKIDVTTSKTTDTRANGYADLKMSGKKGTSTRNNTYNNFVSQTKGYQQMLLDQGVVDEDLNQLIENFPTIKSSNDSINKAMSEIREKLKEILEDQQKVLSDSQKEEESQKRVADARRDAAIAEEDAMSAAQNRKIAIQETINMVSSLGMAISSVVSIANAFSLWSDEDLTTGEKLLQFVQALSFAIPMLASSIMGLVENTPKVISLFLSWVTGQEAATLSTVGFSAVVDGLKLKIGNLKDAFIGFFTEFGIYLAIAAAAAVAIYAIVKAINAEKEAEKAHIEKMKELKETVDETAEAYDNLKASYEDFVNNLEDYDDQVEELNKLTKGTEEYAEALESANEAAKTMIEDSNGLAEWHKDDNGLIVIDNPEEIKSDLSKKTSQAELYSAAAQVAYNQEDYEYALGQIERAVSKTTYSYDNGGTMAHPETKFLSEEVAAAVAKAYSDNQVTDDEWEDLKQTYSDEADLIEDLQSKSSDDLDDLLSGVDSLHDTLEETNKLLAEDYLSENVEGYEYLNSEAQNNLLVEGEQLTESDVYQNAYKKAYEDYSNDKALKDAKAQYAEDNGYTYNKYTDTMMNGDEEIEKDSDEWRVLLANTAAMQEAYTQLSEKAQSYMDLEATTFSDSKSTNDEIIRFLESGAQDGEYEADLLSPEALEQLQSIMENPSADLISAMTALGADADRLQTVVKNIDFNTQEQRYFEHNMSSATSSAELDTSRNVLLANGYEVDFNTYTDKLEALAQSYDNTTDEIAQLTESKTQYAVDMAEVGLEEYKDLVDKSFKQGLTEDEANKLQELKEQLDGVADKWSDILNKQTQSLEIATRAGELAADSGLDAEDIETYANQLKTIEENAEKDGVALAEMAKDQLRYDKAVASCNENLETWTEDIKIANKYGTMLPVDTAEELADAYGDLLDIDGSQLSGDFLKATDNLNLMEKAINGNTDAYNQLLQFAQNDLEITLGVTEDTDFQNTKQQILDDINSWDTDVSVDIDANINDQDFLDKLTELVTQAHMTAEQATDYLSTMGIDAEVEEATETTDEIVGYNLKPKWGAKAGGFANFGTGESTLVEYPELNFETEPVTVQKTTSAAGVKVTSAHKSSGGNVKYKQSSAAHGASNSGKKSSSSGSSSSKKSAIKDDDIDIFHDINIEIENISNNLEDLQDAQEKLVGEDLTNNLQEQLVLLNKQNEAYEKKLKIAEADAKARQAELAKYGVTFDSVTGEITNYEAILRKYLNAANAEIASGSDSETAQDAYDNIKDLISKYDEVINDTIPEIEDSIQDNLDQITETEFEILNVKVDLAIDEEDLLQQWNALKKNLYFDEDDVLGDVTETFGNLLSYFSTNGIAESISRLQAIAVNESLKNADEAAWQEAYQTALEEVNKQIEGAKDAYSDLQKYYEDAIDSVVDAQKEQLEVFDTINDQLEHQIKLAELLYGDDAQKYVADYYAAEADNAKAALATQYSQLQYWADAKNKAQEQLAQGLITEDMYDSIVENYEDALDECNSYLEDALEKIADKYVNIIESSIAQLTSSIANGYTLDSVETLMDMVKEESELYLDDINKAYAIDELRNKWIDAINDTDSLAVQQELTEMMNEQISSLEEAGQLTQYQVDRAEKELEVRLKEQALIDAQNSKSTMRLRRDANGNYTYQYVADDDAITKARQELEDAQNELYNFDKDQWNDYAEQVYDAYKEMSDKIKEIMESGVDEEVGIEQINSVIENYRSILSASTNGLALAQNNVSSDITDITGEVNPNLTNALALLSSDTVVSFLNGASNITDLQNEFINAYKDMKEEEQDIAATYDTSNIASDVITTAVEQANQDLTDSLSDLSSIENMLSQAKDSLSALDVYAEEIANMVSTLTSSADQWGLIADQESTLANTYGLTTNSSGAALVTGSTLADLTNSTVQGLIDGCNSLLSSVNSILNGNSLNSVLDQKVQIDATFPNVTSSSEIEQALNNIINTATQYAYSY